MIKLRRINDSDLELIMDWRMRPDITRFMNTDPVLTLEGQREWLRRVESDPDLLYRMILIKDRPAGVIDLTGLTRPDGVTGWGYYIGEHSLRSCKTAVSREMSMYDYVFLKLHKKAVITNTFSLNRGAIAIHEAVGCELLEERKGEVVKNGVSYDMTYQIMTSDRWSEISPGREYEKVSFD